MRKPKIPFRLLLVAYIVICGVVNPIVVYMIFRDETKEVDKAMFTPETPAPTKGIQSTYEALLAKGMDTTSAAFWARVAAVETGLDHTQGVGARNNIFGMRPRNSKWQGEGFNTTDGVYAVYPTWQYAVNDFWQWYLCNPPKPGESAYSYLKRRQWRGNVPDEVYRAYVKYVNQINFPAQ